MGKVALESFSWNITPKKIKRRRNTGGHARLRQRKAKEGKKTFE